jgi:hypothetical protein
MYIFSIVMLKNLRMSEIVTYDDYDGAETT